MNKKKYFYLIGNLMFYFILINSQTINVPGCSENWKDPKTNSQYNIENLQNNNQDYVIEVPNAPTPYKITLNICRNIINNACSSQSESDVAACQQWPLSNPQWSNSLGKASETMFNSSSSSNSNFQVTFGGTTSTLSILFTCNEDGGVGTPKFLSETTNKFQVSWESQYACPIGSGGNNKGLSGGSIFLIILLVVIVVYFVAGILWQKYRNHATGSDLIPNKEFWTELPILVKDGCKFTVNKIRGKSGYSSV
jgi:hypothetical protein